MGTAKDLEAILAQIEKVLQCNEHFYLYSGILNTIHHIYEPQGVGFSKVEPSDNDDYVIIIVDPQRGSTTKNLSYLTLK